MLPLRQRTGLPSASVVGESSLKKNLDHKAVGGKGLWHDFSLAVQLAEGRIGIGLGRNMSFRHNNPDRSALPI